MSYITILCLRVRKWCLKLFRVLNCMACVRPIRQKEKKMNPLLYLLVKAKLERLLHAKFIKPVEITDWVSPMIIVAHLSIWNARHTKVTRSDTRDLWCHGERAQVILVWKAPCVGNASHPWRLGVMRVKP